MVKKILFMLSLLILSMTFVSASADVAYIFRKDFKIDQNIINVFNEMSLTVELINENNLPQNFNNYRILFVGDENFRNAENIPVNSKPTLIASYHKGNAWGITDRDGVSQLGATSPLKVVKGNSVIVVYTEAFSNNKVAVPYYFLDEENKAPSMTQIASTQTTSSGRKFGDVISHASPGQVMMNGEIQRANLCFFGIIESDYWTPEAKQLFKDCATFTLSGSIPVPEPACSQNSDCSGEEISGPYCGTNGSVYRTETSGMCLNPGTSAAECVLRNENVLVEECAYGCSSGSCLPKPNEEPACFSDDDCPNSETSEPFCSVGTGYEDENVYQNITSYACQNPGETTAECVSSEEKILTEDCLYGCYIDSCLSEPGTEQIHDVSLVSLTGAINNIKLIDSNGSVITDESLMCGEKYQVVIKIDNTGNYTENVSFEGAIGTQTFSHVDVSGFIAGDSKTKTRTITLDVAAETYDLTVRAIIDGFDDANPLDNLATRQVDVVCVD